MLWSVCFFALSPIVLKLLQQQKSLKFSWADASTYEGCLVEPKLVSFGSTKQQVYTEYGDRAIPRNVGKPSYLDTALCPRKCHRMGCINEVVTDALVTWHYSQTVECLRYACVKRHLNISSMLTSCEYSHLTYYNVCPTKCNVTQFILSGNCSTCFGWYHHPLSGAQTTISTASGICHTVTTTCRYSGR